MELELEKLTEDDNKEQDEVPPPGSMDSSSVEEQEEMLKKTPASGDGGDSPVWNGDSQTDLEECRSETQIIDFQPSNCLLFDLD